MLVTNRFYFVLTTKRFFCLLWFALLHLVIGSKISLIFSTNQREKQTNRDSFAHFPALCDLNPFLLWVLIGSTECLCTVIDHTENFGFHFTTLKPRAPTPRVRTGLPSFANLWHVSINCGPVIRQRFVARGTKRRHAKLRPTCDKTNCVTSKDDDLSLSERNA